MAAQRIGAVGNEELLAFLRGLVLRGRFHPVAEHGFDFSVSLAKQPGLDQRVCAILVLLPQYFQVRQRERHPLCGNRGA
ncbi:hypothetical protein D9M69_728700 [compost metagenome]